MSLFRERNVHLIWKSTQKPTQEAQISQFYTGNWTQPIFVDLCEAGNIKFAPKPHVGMTWSAIGAHALKFWEMLRAVSDVCAHRRVVNRDDGRIRELNKLWIKDQDPGLDRGIWKQFSVCSGCFVFLCAQKSSKVTRYYKHLCYSARVDHIVRAWKRLYHCGIIPSFSKKRFFVCLLVCLFLASGQTTF